MKYLKSYNEGDLNDIYHILTEDMIKDLIIDLYDILGNYSIVKTTLSDYNTFGYNIMFYNTNKKIGSTEINYRNPTDDYLETVNSIGDLKNRLKDLNLEIRFSMLSNLSILIFKK